MTEPHTDTSRSSVTIETATGRRAQRVETDVDELARAMPRLVELRNRVAKLSRPLNEPDQPRPSGDVEAAFAAAQAALQQHDELAGSVRNERQAIVSQLDRDDEANAAYAAEQVAWRREALAYATAAALAGTAERVASEYNEPLSASSLALEGAIRRGRLSAPAGRNDRTSRRRSRASVEPAEQR